MLAHAETPAGPSEYLYAYDGNSQRVQLWSTTLEGVNRFWLLPEGDLSERRCQLTSVFDHLVSSSGRGLTLVVAWAATEALRIRARAQASAASSTSQVFEHEGAYLSHRPIESAEAADVVLGQRIGRGNHTITIGEPAGISDLFINAAHMALERDDLHVDVCVQRWCKSGRILAHAYEDDRLNRGLIVYSPVALHDQAWFRSYNVVGEIDDLWNRSKRT
jgi:hypothetical protein